MRYLIPLLLLTACEESTDSQDSGNPSVNNWDAPAVVINEYMSLNQTAHVGVDGETYPDWVELYNASDSDVDLTGWYVSDDPERLDRFELPQGLILPAGETVLLWADDKEDDLLTGIHLNFKLSAESESFLLIGPEDADFPIVDEVSWTNQAADVSAARVPDGSDTWEDVPMGTPGELNAG